PAADKLSLTKDDKGNYFVKDVTATAKYYAATVDTTTGKISFDSDKDVTAAAGTPSAVTTLSREVKFDGADLKADQSLVKYKDDKGKDLYAIQTLDKDGNATFKSVTFAADGKTTEGTAVDLAANVDPLAKIDDALKTVDAFRSQLGAVQNRFESAITNLGNTVNNLSSARSRIEDSDYATEVSNMSRAQILQQAGTSVLAQANQVPQNVLSLLR
ncbi:flagellin, partial [Salmonella enterica]